MNRKEFILEYENVLAKATELNLPVEELINRDYSNINLRLNLFYHHEGIARFNQINNTNLTDYPKGDV